MASPPDLHRHHFIFDFRNDKDKELGKFVRVICGMAALAGIVAGMAGFVLLVFNFMPDRIQLDWPERRRWLIAILCDFGVLSVSGIFGYVAIAGRVSVLKKRSIEGPESRFD
jgi:hypothetical protein